MKLVKQYDQDIMNGLGCKRCEQLGKRVSGAMFTRVFYMSRTNLAVELDICFVDFLRPQKESGLP